MRLTLSFWAAAVILASSICAVPAAEKGRAPHELDRILDAENAGLKIKAAPVVEDLPFLRRITIDLIGRIPTQPEIDEFQAWPSNSRRTQVIDKLIADERFADRWTVFYADMLRLRSNAEGGNAFLAFIHQAVQKGMPYDEMCRQLIVANGKANYTPEVGFVLGDGADPMALAGVTSQTFLGIRIACAQCHDHPFDVWKREDFYGLAAYFGKTRRVENQFTKTVYTTEADQSTVLWPPEGVVPAEKRKPMVPKFPFAMDEADGPHIARLNTLRIEQQKSARSKQVAQAAPSVDDLLDEADAKVKNVTTPAEVDATGVLDENRQEVKNLKLGQDFRSSELRRELAGMITNPRNRSFSRALVNRVWADLIGHGFVEPIDDFSEGNQPNRPKTLDYLADEFVASGYNLRTLVRLIVTSDVYQRAPLTNADEAQRTAAELAFLAAPVRRMLSEVLYDSIVAGGHLFEVKHEAGKNEKEIWRHEQIAKAPRASGEAAPKSLTGDPAKMPAKPKTEVAQAPAYDLEKAIELDFNAVLKAKDDEPQVEAMKMVSKEELEAQMMQNSMRRPGIQYLDRFVRMTIDDNPQFSTALRMATPAPPSHFLRIFGQPPRDALGDVRDHSATMRQALMMLNGRLTHEASRVGEIEPVYALISSKKPDLPGAIRLVYRELLTREPTAAEISEAQAILKESPTAREGIADLRWVLFNCHEFRYLP